MLNHSIGGVASGVGVSDEGPGTVGESMGTSLDLQIRDDAHDHTLLW